MKPFAPLALALSLAAAPSLAQVAVTPVPEAEAPMDVVVGEDVELTTESVIPIQSESAESLYPSRDAHRARVVQPIQGLTGPYCPTGTRRSTDETCIATSDALGTITD
jgi:hypothetical protein